MTKSSWEYVIFMIIIFIGGCIGGFVWGDVYKGYSGALKKEAKSVQVESTIKDKYVGVHIPCFDKAGIPSSDIVADEAVWDRVSGRIDFVKPVVYQYQNGKTIRRLEGDTGKTKLVGGEIGPVNVRGNVKVRTYQNKTEE